MLVLSQLYTFLQFALCVIDKFAKEVFVVDDNLELLFHEICSVTFLSESRKTVFILHAYFLFLCLLCF